MGILFKMMVILLEKHAYKNRLDERNLMLIEMIMFLLSIGLLFFFGNMFFSFFFDEHILVIRRDDLPEHVVVVVVFLLVEPSVEFI